MFDYETEASACSMEDDMTNEVEVRIKCLESALSCTNDHEEALEIAELFYDYVTTGYDPYNDENV